MKMPDSFAARASEEAFDAFRLAEAGHRLQDALAQEWTALDDRAGYWMARVIGAAYGDYVSIGLDVFNHIEERVAAEAA